MCIRDSTTAGELQAQQTGTAATNATAGEFKGPHVHHCPCFVSNNSRDRMGEVLFTLTVTNSEVTLLKWATRNLVRTLPVMVTSVAHSIHAIFVTPPTTNYN